MSPTPTVGDPAFSIVNQINLQAAAADAMQHLIPGNELKPGNRLRRAPGGTSPRVASNKRYENWPEGSARGR